MLLVSGKTLNKGFLPFSGVERFQRDIETMLGPQSRIYWIILTVLWKFVSPAFLLVSNFTFLYTVCMLGNYS